MERTIQLFKALSDKSRLKIIISLVEGPMYVELLSQRLGLSSSTVSFHLKKLEECGLVTSSKEQYYVMFTLNKDVLEGKIIDIIKADSIDKSEEKKREDSYRKEIVDSCFKNGKLVSMPVQQEKKKIILEEISKLFQEGIGYTEKEVNIMLVEITDMFFIIKTELIKNNILKFTNEEFYVGDEQKLLDNRYKKKVPPEVKSKLRVSENIICVKKKDYKVNITDKIDKDFKDIAIYLTNIGRILIERKAIVKGFELTHIYSYNYVTKEQKKKLSAIYYNDVDNTQIESIINGDKVICKGEKLRAKSEDGLRTIDVSIEIKFTLEEFKKINDNIKTNLFKVLDEK